jgi:hypothetical protein
MMDRLLNFVEKADRNNVGKISEIGLLETVITSEYPEKTDYSEWRYAFNNFCAAFIDHRCRIRQLRMPHL